MTQDSNKLGEALWGIADDLRGSMNAANFQDYMLSFIFLRYLSANYENIAKNELGDDYRDIPIDILSKMGCRTPLELWYEENEPDIPEFEKLMRRSAQYVIKPEYLWDSIVELARVQDNSLLETLQYGFSYIENESFDDSFYGLFSEINLNSDKLGKDNTDRNKKLCDIITQLHKGLNDFSDSIDSLGNAYEYLIGKFAANAGQKAGEFYTPQYVSDILSKIVVLDNQDPATGNREKLDTVFDFACGSGSLLLNVNRESKEKNVTIGKIYGQEKNVTTYNLARMNMILHGVRDSQFEIFHGDTLTNDWDMLCEPNPAKKMEFDAIVANPPFSLKWKPNDATSDDVRFNDHGVAPKSAADFAFLLHGLHYLKDDGTMAIILPHGVLFRGGAESRIRKKLLEDGNIDAVIGLPSNLFYSTGIPVCILIIKKCKKEDDILFIDASTEGNFKKEKRQNRLERTHVNDIVNTYKNRAEKDRYSRRVKMEEIIENDYNLNISRYIDTSIEAEPVDMEENITKLVELDKKIQTLTEKHNEYLKQLGYPLLPTNNE